MYQENEEITPQTEFNEPSEPTKRTSSKQRRESLEEYRQIFLTAPKITDRQTAFISRGLRDDIDRIVRILGDRKMSVSGFVENVLRDHLAHYTDDIDRWRKL